MRAAWLLAALTAVVGCARTSQPGEGQAADDGDGDQDALTEADEPLVLFGQTASTVNSNLEYGMEQPASVAVCNGRLIVADQLQARVLIWNSLPASGAPSLVLGQPTLTTRASNYAGVDARGLDGPSGIACTGNTLAVVDNGNSRVLLWKPLPTESFEAATVVLGQPDFSTSSAGTDSATMSGPQGVAIIGNSLYVADTNNHRILVWSSIPTTSGASASIVLGQANFTNGAANAGGAVSANGLASPTAIASDGVRFFVADTDNNRVLVWNNIPGTGSPPSFVLGQATFTNGAAAPSETLASLSQPQGLTLVGSLLLVADTQANRVAGFSSAITANNQPANVTFGKSPHGGGVVPIYDATTLEAPRGMAFASPNLYVADSGAHRVVVLDAPATLGATDARAVLGQPNLGSGAKRAPLQGVDGTALGLPMDVAVSGDQVFVVDFLYHRVLGWNAIPWTGGTSADFVLGQPDLLAYDAHDVGAGASAFKFPTAALVVNGDLHVVDRDFNRILVWTGVPTSNVPASRVLGQPDFDTVDVHPAADGASFRQPTMVASDGTRYAVADQSNNRVLVWNGVPTDAGDQADIILGQSAPDIVTSNTGGISPSALRNSRGVTLTPEGIIVADTGNNRVLIWNRIPTSNAAPADVVLGQGTMFTADALPPSRSSLGGPTAVFYGDGLLFVSNGNRISVWRGIPTVNDTPADYVVGQTRFDRDLPNDGGLTIDTLQSPCGVRVVDDDIFIADAENDRVVRRPKPAP